MQKEELLACLRNPGTLNKETLDNILMVVEQYPYFQSARLLALKNRFLINDAGYQTNIESAAAYVCDRKVIYSLLYPLNDVVHNHEVVAEQATDEDLEQSRAVSDVLENAYSHSHGIRDLLAFDFENCKYILSFGAQFLTNWPTSLEVQRAYGERRSKPDLKIVQVEPRFSLAASRADRWIPIHPGTEGLLALGIASVMVRERLYDEEFIDRFTSKFEDWTDQRGEKVEGFRTAILRRFRLEDISDKTGVPLKTLIETAKEFSSSERALAIAEL